MLQQLNSAETVVVSIVAALTYCTIYSVPQFRMFMKKGHGERGGGGSLQAISCRTSSPRAKGAKGRKQLGQKDVTTAAAVCCMGSLSDSTWYCAGTRERVRTPDARTRDHCLKTFEVFGG